MTAMPTIRVTDDVIFPTNGGMVAGTNGTSLKRKCWNFEWLQFLSRCSRIQLPLSG
ncbi:MAG: hypothetical protein JWM97_2504 [Phycisphaerales bacterium]|nr:hypothetical protein [Phycisphaerales bacterium]